MWVCLPQATTCPRSSDATAAIWTRRPSPTDRWLSTLAESRRGNRFSFLTPPHCMTIPALLSNHDVPPFLLALHIHQNKTRPAGVPVCGMDSATSGPPSGQSAWLCCVVLSAQMNTERVITHALLTEWTALFSWQTQGPLWLHKLTLKNTNADYIIEIRQVHRCSMCWQTGRQHLSLSVCLSESRRLILTFSISSSVAELMEWWGPCR